MPPPHTLTHDVLQSMRRGGLHSSRVWRSCKRGGRERETDVANGVEKSTGSTTVVEERERKKMYIKQGSSRGCRGSE
jgi:hypothetical protein